MCDKKLFLPIGLLYNPIYVILIPIDFEFARVSRRMSYSKNLSTQVRYNIFYIAP